jgi:hypothetical protein
MSERTFGATGSSDGEMEVAANVPSVCPANGDGTEANGGERSDEQDPFAGSAEDVAAEETRRKVELFAWADSVLEVAPLVESTGGQGSSHPRRTGRSRIPRDRLAGVSWLQD